MNGELFYLAAVKLTDLHPGVQFREMLTHDSSVGGATRLYFLDELRDLPLMGWNQFCLEMENSGQKKWLTRIKKLDENIMLNHLETRLMEASRDGRTPNRALLESTVKALQGVTALNKVSGEDDFDSDGIEVRFVPSLNEPIEPETAEQMYERLKSELSLEGSDD